MCLVTQCSGHQCGSAALCAVAFHLQRAGSRYSSDDVMACRAAGLQPSQAEPASLHLLEPALLQQVLVFKTCRHCTAKGCIGLQTDQ